MGVKIDKAFYIKTKKIISNFEADKQGLTGEKFSCPICNATLSFTKHFEKNYPNKVVKVSPFFSLIPKVVHNEDCKYNTAGRVKKIMKKAIELKDFIEMDPSKKPIIRLQVVTEELESKENPKDDVPNENDAHEMEVENDGSLSPYLSAMKQIMILRSEVENNNVLKSEIKLKYKKKMVSWDNFYFGQKEVEYIKLTKYLDKKSIPKHPVCIEGYITKPLEYVKFPNKSEFHKVFIEMPYINGLDDEGKKEIPSVSFLIPIEMEHIKRKIESEMQKGNNQIVAYGKPYFKKNTGRQPLTEYHNVTLYINKKAQFHCFNDTM
ncbi:hypothetical protein ACIQYG_21915 [Peribacillus sp. NPDC096622]|uniref:hypothetical protein n=1 Tax=Peribacillus sp. NPDC096622 TaxID=3364396 RepID=UPI003829153B